MESEKPTLLNQGLKFGLILGFSQVIIYLLLYIIDKNLLVSFWVAGLMMAVSIALIVYPVRNYKSTNEGIITFKDAFLICIITIAGGVLITSVYNYLLYNIIDTSLSEFIKEKAIEKASAMMEKFNAPQEDIEKAITQMQAEDFSQSPSKIGSQFLSSILLGSIPSLIVAAILRTKNKPVDDIQ